MCVVSAQVPIVRGCGTEEDGGRQVVPFVFEELVHLTGDARLNGHSVTWTTQVWFTALVQQHDKLQISQR